jgi:hypothetical protein
MKHIRPGGLRLPVRALALGLLLVPATAFAQNAPAQGPLVIERVHNPFVVAPDYKVTDFNGELGQLAGVYAGRSVEDALFIGGAGYWLVNGSRGDELAYGGVMAGWSMPAGSRIRFGVRSLVGVGRATLATDVDVTRGLVGRGRGFDDGRGGGGGIRPGDIRGTTRFGRTDQGGAQASTIRVRARDDFFVFEPQADLLTRISSHFALNWAAGYRLTALTDVLDDGRLDGATGSVALQLQW